MGRERAGARLQTMTTLPAVLCLWCTWCNPRGEATTRGWQGLSWVKAHTHDPGGSQNSQEQPAGTRLPESLSGGLLAFGMSVWLHGTWCAPPYYFLSKPVFSGLSKCTGNMVPISQSIWAAEPDAVNADVDLELSEMKHRQHPARSADQDGHRDRIYWEPRQKSKDWLLQASLRDFYQA